MGGNNEVEIMAEEQLERQIEQVAERLRAKGWMLVFAESCTGGWLAKTATDLPGSSEWFERGFVTYSNDAKRELLGVRPKTLSEHGAVSEATVREMAEGALRHSRGAVSVAVSGIAGPGGGTPEKPIGTVWFAWSINGEGTRVRHELLSGDRETIRFRAVEVAWQGLLDALS